MGYTHYWYRPASIGLEEFKAIRCDFEQLLLPLSDTGVHIAGWDGERIPQLTDELITFNGLSDCGHALNEEIVIPYPAADAQGVGPSVTAVGGVEQGLLRIKHRCCNGSCCYETFHFPRTMELGDYKVPNEYGLFLDHVKTGFRPYDIAVTAILLIAKRHLQDQFIIHSNGADAQWLDAKRICQHSLGYGDWFGILEQEVDDSWTDSAGVVHKRMALERELIEIAPDRLLSTD